MATLKAPSALVYRDTFTFTDNAGTNALGTEGPDALGQKYRWAKAGATTLVVGHILAAPRHNASQVDLAVNTSLAVVGATSFTVTPNAAVTANQFRGGKLLVSNGGGLGLVYSLGPHAAGNSTVNVVFNLAESQSIQVAANSTTFVDLYKSQYDGVVDNPAIPVSYPVGVAVAPITNGQYGLIGTEGTFPVLIEGTPGIGQPVSPSGNVAGAVSAYYTSNSTVVTALSNNTIIGTMAETGVDGKYKMVKLRLQ